MIRDVADALAWWLLVLIEPPDGLPVAPLVIPLLPPETGPGPPQKVRLTILKMRDWP